MAERLSEPRWLRFTPPGFDAGESGQFRTVRARALKARARDAVPRGADPRAGRGGAGLLPPAPRAVHGDLAAATRACGSGRRSGCAARTCTCCPTRAALGCAVVGAHVHVRHRANPNGALAKSRFPRTVPASDAVLASYADYQHERAGLAGDDGTDMVLVNLYHEPLGAPMTYRAAKGFFERLARGVRVPGPAAHAAAYRGHQLGPGRDRS